MAADEVMLHAAVAGRASFRLYGWSEPTVSLGYFQPHQVRGPGLAELPYVRRHTGGLTLVHHHELTYGLGLPSELSQQPVDWLEKVHRIIADGLAQLEVRADTALDNEAPATETPLCFHHVTRGDLTIGGHKVVGSAQRHRRGALPRHGALLQHGAILLATSPFTPTLPGLE